MIPLDGPDSYLNRLFNPREDYWDPFGHLSEMVNVGPGSLPLQHCSCCCCCPQQQSNWYRDSDCCSRWADVGYTLSLVGKKINAFGSAPWINIHRKDRSGTIKINKYISKQRLLGLATPHFPHKVTVRTSSPQCPVICWSKPLHVHSLPTSAANNPSSLQFLAQEG